MSDIQPENLSIHQTITDQNNPGNTIGMQDATTDALLAASAQTSFIQSKSHVLPVVYFQPPITNSNVLFNAVPLTKSNNATLAALQGNQSVILGKAPQLLIQKNVATQQTVVPITVSLNNSLKNTVALLTVPKTTNTIPPLRTHTGQLIKSKAETLHIVPNMANVTTNPGHKYLIAPMPKVTSNRLPITATTNCNLQSKIAFMPITIPKTESKQKVFNLKIANGKIHNERPLKIKTDMKNLEKQTKIKNDKCDNDTSKQDKSYQLSIVEDSSSRSDVSYTVTIPDEMEKPNLDPLPKTTNKGISILKKNINSNERQTNNSDPNSFTTISDLNTKEVKIEVEEAPPPVQKPQVKPERRRKANNSYRKDYDEIEPPKPSNWVSSDKFDTLIASEVKFSKTSAAENHNITRKNEEEKRAADFFKENLVDVNDNFDESKVLHWEDGIGTLPGSNLKFQINEFGLLEYLTEEDLKRMFDGNIEKIKIKEEKIKYEYGDDLRCLECGCFGLPSEFITSEYCSLDCQRSGEKYIKDRDIIRNSRKRKKIYCKKAIESENMDDRDSSPSDGENARDVNSNENSQDKVTNYRWKRSKKGFSWSSYLTHGRATAAPVKLFKDPFPYSRNGFRVGMKLEGIDPQHPKYFCVLTVVEILGYRIRLHFDGYPSNYDFWANADSKDIFPTGWCEKNGHILLPPPNIRSDEFTWLSYLKLTKSTAAPKHLFSNRPVSNCLNHLHISTLCMLIILSIFFNRNFFDVLF